MLEQVLRSPWHSFRKSRTMRSSWLYPGLASLTLVASALPALFVQTGLFPSSLLTAGGGLVLVRSEACDLAPGDPHAAAHPVDCAAANRGSVQLEDAQCPATGGLAVGFVGGTSSFLTGWVRPVPPPFRHLPLCLADMYARSMNGPLPTGWGAHGVAEVPPGFGGSWAVDGDGWFRPSLRMPHGANPKHRSFPHTQTRP